MLVDNVLVEYPAAMPEAEAVGYAREEIAWWQKKKEVLGRIIISLAGDEAVIKSIAKSPIRRIRRITGYLSEVSNFNDAKQAELRDRKVQTE